MGAGDPDRDSRMPGPGGGLAFCLRAVEASGG